jgi:hypothetical protein
MRKFCVIIFAVVMLLSMSSISVATSSFQADIKLTRVNQGPPPKPTVDIIYPLGGAILEFGTYTINVLATDSNGIVKVEIKIDGSQSTRGWVDITASKTGDHYYYYWAVGTEGDYSITARATNAAGKHADDAVKVTVVATAPPPTEPVHDVAVTSVSASSTSVTAGEVVTITVVVENQGTETETFDVYIYADTDTVVIGDEIVIDFISVVSLETGASTTLSVTWDTKGVVEDNYTISPKVPPVSGEEDTADNTFTDGTVTVTAPGAPPTATHELFIEIDYMEGHAPTQAVLDYIESYYMGNNPSGELISVTFHVNDIVPLEASVSDTDFWAIEAAYNNLGDDKYTGQSANFVSKWKWVLFGTTVEGEPNVVGYTYVLTRGSDLLAGNYIFIADETGDSWASNNEIYDYGAEAVVLMHEMGHSIGIANFHPAFGEIYDPDPYSVMSYLSTDNAGLYSAWYYSDEYWNTRNLEYYTT